MTSTNPETFPPDLYMMTLADPETFFWRDKKYITTNDVRQATDDELTADAAIERDWIKMQQLHYRSEDDRRKNDEEFDAAPEDVKPAITSTGDYFAQLSFNPTPTMMINLRIGAYQS
ncbi:hypothetical protein MMC22_005747 [Lobaria immixta]|nr:hypothetical protein [Lobaria immixta]